MARLQIGVEQLGAAGFRLELPGTEGETNIVALAPGGGIRGRYEQDTAQIGLRGVRADTLCVSELSWQMMGGRLELVAPGTLRDVKIDATIALGGGRPPFVGGIRARELEATARMTRGTTVVQATRLKLVDFELTVADDGVAQVRAASISAGAVAGEVGPVAFDATDATAVHVMGTSGRGGSVERFDLASLEFKLADLPARSPAKTPPPVKTPPSQREPPAVLDAIAGHVNADVTLDVAVPVVGSRSATHRFRIPVDAGTIDYGTLMDGLATLEGLVLNLGLRDDRLVLEKDIPLVPFDNVTLVQWPLDEAGRELAASGRVKLASLLQPQLPPAADKTEDTSPIRRIDVDNIDVALAVGGPTTLTVGAARFTLGHAEHPAAVRLALDGELRHVPGEAVPGRLTLRGETFVVGPSAVPLRSGRVSVDGLRLQTLDAARLELAGLRPTSVHAKLAGLALTGIQLEL